MSALNSNALRVTVDGTVVIGLDTFNVDTDNPVTVYPTFDNPEGEAVAGTPKRAISLGGLYLASDAGQAKLIVAGGPTGGPITVAVKPDGTTATTTGTYRVTKITHTGKPGTPQTVTYALTGTGEIVTP
jgi:hypothetical protein